MADSAEVEGNETDSMRPAAARAIGYSRWSLLTCAAILLGSVGLVAVNIWIDVFGLYGRNNVRPHLLERYSYHLLSERFVPSNFNEIFLGNSQSGNWDTSLIPNHRIYNVSCGGSNLHEQVLLAHDVLISQSLRAVYIFMYPSMMSDTLLPTAYVTDKDRWSALGSVQNLVVYAEVLKDDVLAHLKHNPRLREKYFPYGGHNSPRGHRETRPALPPSFWELQPEALGDLRTLLMEAKARGAHVYFVVPPIYTPYYSQYQAQFDDFYKKMAVIAGPDVSTIDLLHDDSLRSIRDTKADYPDLLHPIDAVTPAIVGVMARQLNDVSDAADQHHASR